MSYFREKIAHVRSLGHVVPDGIEELLLAIEETLGLDKKKADAKDPAPAPAPALQPALAPPAPPAAPAPVAASVPASAPAAAANPLDGVRLDS